MKPNLLVRAIIACALLGAGCSYTEKAATSLPSEPLKNTPLASAESSVEGFLDADAFVVRELMADGQKPLAEEEDFECKKYRAGIVNHHALASDLLGAFFRTLARCQPEVKTLIILSPDHFNRASAAVTVHQQPYRLSGGEVGVEQSVVARALAAIPSSRDDASLFIREHGIGALVPFLADQDWTIAPVVIRNQVTDTDRKAIADWLAGELKQPSVFVVVSSDMSHYLPADAAWLRQEESNRALADSDEDFFRGAKDDHTDNGESIAAVIRALGKTTWHPIKEAISSDYAGSPGFTTTYVIGFWE